MCDECHHATTVCEQEGYLQERSRTIGDTALAWPWVIQPLSLQWKAVPGTAAPSFMWSGSSFWGIHERWESNPRG